MPSWFLFVCFGLMCRWLMRHAIPVAESRKRSIEFRLCTHEFVIWICQVGDSLWARVDDCMRSQLDLYVCLFVFIPTMKMTATTTTTEFKVSRKLYSAHLEWVFGVNIESLCFSFIHSPNSSDKGKSFKLKLLNRVMNSEFRLNINEQTNR